MDYAIYHPVFVLVEGEGFSFYAVIDEDDTIEEVQAKMSVLLRRNVTCTVVECPFDPSRL